jgi:hypothetical protein
LDELEKRFNNLKNNWWSNLETKRKNINVRLCLHNCSCAWTHDSFYFILFCIVYVHCFVCTFIDLLHLSHFAFQQ